MCFYPVRSKGSRTEFFTAFLPLPSTGTRLNYVVETVSHKSANWRQCSLLVVKTERLALTVVVTLCRCREMDVKEEQGVEIKFCFKVDFSATKTVELIQKACRDAALTL